MLIVLGQLLIPVTRVHVYRVLPRLLDKLNKQYIYIYIYIYIYTYIHLFFIKALINPIMLLIP